MTAIITMQRVISLENISRIETVQLDSLSISHNSTSTSSYQPPSNCIRSAPVDVHSGSVNEGLDSFLTRSNDDPFDDDGFEYSVSNFKRWSVVVGSFFGLLSAFGFINSGGVIQTYIITHQLADVDTTTISWIFSIFTCLSLICTIFSGTYFDRNGARIPLIIGSIIHTASLFSIGNCTVVWQFILALGVGVGIASGVLIAVYISVIAQYFSKKERSIPMAIATNGSGVGGFMYPLILRKSYESLGFMWSMRLCSFISLICLGIAFFLVKERRLVEPDESDGWINKFKIYFLKSFDLKAVFREPCYALNIIGCTFGESTTIVTSTFFSYILVSSGYSQSDSYLFVTILNAVSVFGRYLAGFFADKYFGPHNVIIVLLLSVAAINMVIWLPFIRDKSALWVYTVSYGMFSGGILSLIPSCCSQVVRADHFGQRYATMYAINGAIILGLIPVGGSIVDNGQSLERIRGFIGYVSLMCVLSALAYMMSRVKIVGLKMKNF